MSQVVIVGAKRTPLGALLGQFTGVPATTLGATAIKAALEQSGVKPEAVSEVIMRSNLEGEGKKIRRERAGRAPAPRAPGPPHGTTGACVGDDRYADDVAAFRAGGTA